MRIGQHLLAYRLATAVCLDAVDHGLQFLGSVDREHLAHNVAFLVAVFEPHGPAGALGPQLPVPPEGKFGRLAFTTTVLGLLSVSMGRGRRNAEREP